MTEIEAIKKIPPVLKRIQQDINIISALLDTAAKNPEDFDEAEAAEYIAKIGEEWEDELTDAKNLLEITRAMNQPTPEIDITFDDDPGNTP